MRPKARFIGGNSPEKVSPNIDRLIRRLRELWPHNGTSSDVWGHPGEQFEQSLVDVLLWATAAREQGRNATTKEDARAELAKLKKQLDDAEKMLRCLSPDVDLLLGAQASPLDCADAIRRLVGHVGAAEARIAQGFDSKSQTERERQIAKEICWRVLEVFGDYGHAASATAVVDLEQQSPAVSVLCVIGESAGIVRSPATWRDLLAETMRGKE